MGGRRTRSGVDLGEEPGRYTPNRHTQQLSAGDADALSEQRTRMARRRAATIALVALALGACGKKPSKDETQAPPTAFGVDLAAIDESVRPGDDFYRYVNGRWLAEVKIPEDRSSYGVFSDLADRAETRVKALLETAKSAPAQSNARKAADFYAAFLDTAAIEEKGLRPLGPDLARIEAIKTPRDLMAAFGRDDWRVAAPFALTVDIDAKRPDRYAAYLGQSGLGMPARAYYFDPKFEAQRTRYRAYIEALLTLSGRDDAAEAADAVYALEEKIAAAQWEPEKRRNRDLTYNPKSRAALKAFAPEVDWDAYLDAAGLGATTNLIVREDEAVQKLAALVAAEPLDAWRAYLEFHLLDANAEVLPAAFGAAKFEFAEKTLKGAPHPSSLGKRAIAATVDAMGDAVGHLYADAYFTPQSKAAIIRIVADIRAAFAERLDTLSWMSAETKDEAKRKLDLLTAKIGAPETWRDYSALTVARDDAFGNAAHAAEFEQRRRLARLDEAVDRSEWTYAPETINAGYIPALNEIIFPAAILEPPLFDPHADPAVNYGAIGAVIGHELGHAFDDQGRKSDGAGVLRNWWANADDAAFSRLALKLGAQYDAYEPLPGVALNSALTIGENIGDLGGVEVAYRAYRRSLHGKEAPVIDGLTGDQRFFLAWAQIWRRAVREAQLRNQIATNVHPPAEFRVNGVVRNIDAWYRAFDVKPGDALYLRPEDRVEIW